MNTDMNRRWIKLGVWLIIISLLLLGACQLTPLSGKDRIGFMSTPSAEPLISVQITHFTLAPTVTPLAPTKPAPTNSPTSTSTPKPPTPTIPAPTVPAPTITSTSTPEPPTPTIAVPTVQASATATRDVTAPTDSTGLSQPVFMGALAAGYAIGLNTSGGETTWLTDMHDGSLRMDYPNGQQWGAVFITVGRATQPPHLSYQDLSYYTTLSLELRGEVGSEKVWVGLKDTTDPDDGSETKIPVDLTTGWQTFKFPLSGFDTADLAKAYVVTEFVFEPGTPAETVYFRNVQFLATPK